MKSILDKSFVYVPSHKTNIKERFDRMKAEKEERAKKERLMDRIVNLPERKKSHG